MIEVQVNIFMVLLLGSIAVHAYLKFNRKEPVHQLFFALIVLTIVILLLEMLSVLLNSASCKNLLVLHKLVDTAGFVLAPLAPIVAALYVYKRTNRYIRLKISKIIWLGAPALGNAIVSLGSYQYNWIFSITNENLYLRGPLFFISPVFISFYYCLILWLLYDNRMKINDEERVMLSLLPTIPFLLSVFQLYYFVYLTIWNSLAIAVVMNYIFILHNQTKIDPLTGLGNRLAYDEYIANLSHKSKLVLSVVNIDLDDFKSINNQYGHHEGDKVLRAFAGELKAVFDDVGMPIRVGGDEFIVWIRENNPAIIAQYMATLADRVKTSNENMGRPYRVGFSYGMTVLNAQHNDLQELVQHSDKLMYEEKQKKAGPPLNIPMI
jgi:diguanylate cyclase (GGDEF)-like protein